LVPKEEGLKAWWEFIKFFLKNFRKELPKLFFGYWATLRLEGWGFGRKGFFKIQGLRRKDWFWTFLFQKGLVRLIKGFLLFSLL